MRFASVSINSLVLNREVPKVSFTADPTLFRVRFVGTFLTLRAVGYRRIK